MKILPKNMNNNKDLIITYTLTPAHPTPYDPQTQSIDFLLTKQVTPREPDQKFTRSSISRRALP